MSIDAQQTLEVPIENVNDLAKFLVNQTGNQGVGGNHIVHVSDVSAPILQVQDAVAAGTVIQVSDGSVAPMVQMSDNQQPIYITEGFPNGIQILDGPFIQSSDGTSIIQLATPGLVSGGNMEGLTQIVQFAGGQVALVEQQENLDPQNVQFVLEQPVSHQHGNQVEGEMHLQVNQVDGEMQLQQQMLMDTAAPEHIIKPEPQQRPAQQEEEITQPPIGKGPFICEICEKKLDKWNQYQRHMKSHEDDKPFRCFNCPASFNIADNLKLHLATHVEPGDKPICPECGKKFSRVASLKAHIMMHEKEESLMCPECGDEFSLQGQLDKHVLDHQEDREGTRVYSCRQCNASFANQKELKDHTKQHFKIKKSMSHRTYKKEIDRSGFSHKCQHCMKTFQKPSQLLRHERVHTGDRPFKCSMCNKAFNQKGALQMHVLGRHTSDKPHKCQFCKAGFSQKGNLRAHVQRVHTITNESIDQTLYKCDECPCIFKKLGSLNAHISRFHTGVIESEGTQKDVTTQEGVKDAATQEGAQDVIQQLLELSEAGSTQQPAQSVSDDILQQALQNSGLPGSGNNTNTAVVEPKSGGTMSVMNVRDTATGAIKKHYVRKLGSTTWHQCSFCMKEFKKPSDLVRHTRIHSHEKPYKCTQCFRAFAVKSTLNSHIRTHTGIKQYKCNVCEKNFSTHGSLKVHLRLHTGAKPFDCSYCDKRFRTPAHRRNHLASHFKVPVQKRSDPELKKLGDLNDITLQEPILITDTGFIQQPPRNNVFNQYLGESNSLDRPYKCPHCQRAFKKSSHLKQHIRSHTGEKPYKCLTCSHTFVSNGVLKAHIRIHTGLKHYKCVMCDNLFSTNGSLKRHMSTHSEVRPFMCPYCQRTFKTNVNCRKHMKTHRAELAVQMTKQNPMHMQSVDELNTTTDLPGTEQYVEEEAVDNDLMVNQDLNHTSTVTQNDLGQQTILTQGLQDALGLGSSNMDSNLLNQQQMFTTQQTFTQSLLGSGQQNFQQMNTQIANVDQQQNQYHIQQQQHLNQTDLNNYTPPPENVIQIVTSETVQSVQALSNEQQAQVDGTQYVVTEAMPSTSMQNILETSESTPVDEVQTEEVTAVINSDGRRTYVCEFCNKIFKKSSHLKQHVRSHTGEKPYKCPQCPKTFVAMGVLRQHLRTHTGVKEYKCSVCHAMFTTNGSLTRHMNTHVSVKPYKCPFCLEGFRTASLCKKHMREHTGGDEDEEAAPSSEEQVTVPAVAMKKPRPRLVEVPQSVVQKSASNDMNISQKILVESASEKDRISEVKELAIQAERHAHECPQCPKSFKKPSDLVRHIRIHTGEKPFNCSICGRTFTVKSTLDSHMKTHGGFEKTIRCHICNSMFSTKGSLKVHMRLHTGAKPFKCPHCPQRFRTSGHRKSHILTHYKDNSSLRKKRNAAQTINIQEVPQTNDHMDYINQVDTNQTLQQVIAQGQNQGQIQMGQVINIDQSMLNANMVPLSLTVDGYGNLTDNSVLQLQGLEGIPLQLAGGNLAQGIQITGLDQNTIGQTVHIDANILQQLQSGNFNVAMNPNQATDPNMVPNLANIQLQPMSIQDGVNPNLVVQPLGAINIDQTGLQQAGLHQGAQSAQIALNQDIGQGTYVMTSNNGIVTEQQVGADQVITQHAQQVVQQEHVIVPEHVIERVKDDDEGSNISDDDLQHIEQQKDMLELTTDIDQETSDMRAIDPNMTTHLPGSMMAEHQEDVSDNEDQGDLDDSHLIEEGVSDNGQELHDDDDDLQATKITDQIMPVNEPFISANNPTDNEDLSDTRLFTCHVCQKSFKRNSHLKEHIKTHLKSPGTQSKEKMGFHVCPHCDKRFQKPSQLDRHVRIHTGERPFGCIICGKAFNQKNALQIHLKKHSGERPHRCQYCDTAFTQKGNLKTHIKRAHHTDMVTSMNLRGKSVAKIQGDVTGDSVNEAVGDKDQVITEDINLSEVSDFFTT